MSYLLSSRRCGLLKFPYYWLVTSQAKYQQQRTVPFLVYKAKSNADSRIAISLSIKLTRGPNKVDQELSEIHFHFLADVLTRRRILFLNSIPKWITYTFLAASVG